MSQCPFCLAESKIKGRKVICPKCSDFVYLTSEAEIVADNIKRKRVEP